MYFGHEGRSSDQFGQIEANLRAVFGKTYAAEPEILVKELADDEAVAAADTLLLTVPNQLGVDYNAHVIESVLRDVAPAASESVPYWFEVQGTGPAGNSFPDLRSTSFGTHIETNDDRI